MRPVHPKLYAAKAAQRIAILTAGWFAAWAAFAPAPMVHGAENIRQYRAAMTEIFLWRYSALPLYTINQLQPGDVIQLDTEIKYLARDTCYNSLKHSHYHAIRDFKQGLKVSTAIDLKIGGELLNKKIANIDAEDKARFDQISVVTVSPLSVAEVSPDAAALRKINGSPACSMIPGILDGKLGKYAVVSSVLFGRVNFSLSANFSDALSAEAKGELVKEVAKSFGISEASIAVSEGVVSFAVSESPGNLPLAYIPPEFSREELARITNYLQGKRGADLEIAVREALTAGQVGVFEEATLKIKSLLGDDEIAKKEHWAENIVNGGEMTPIPELQPEKAKDVDFHKVAIYAAAMELLRLEAPSRNR